MNWLEIIEIRSVDGKRERLKMLLNELISEVQEVPKKLTIKAFCHVEVETDFCIHLFHDSTKAKNYGSPLGTRLSSALKEFGYVNHRIWTELHSQ